MATAGFYIHFPLCRRKCLYCDFASFPCGGRDIPGLVSLIVREIGLLDTHFPTVDTVFIGGGTPSLLSPAQVGRILAAVRKRFDVTARPEVSLEVNPESASLARLRGWRAAGVNRISMGIQCLDDRILRTLGRLADRRQVLKAAALPARAGFENFSFDLMFGLPFQDIPLFLGDIRAMIPFGPKHVSLYSLHVPRGSGLAKKLRRSGLRLGDDSGHYHAGRDLLESEGFGQYEVSNFAKPGFRCRHNLHYWDYDPYAAAGPAAVAFDGSTRRRNHSSLAAYARLLRAGRLPVRTQEKIDDATRRNEYIMMNLRKSEGIDPEAYGKIFGTDFAEENRGVIGRLSGRGLLRAEKGRFRVDRAAMFVSNSVIREFFR